MVKITLSNSRQGTHPLARMKSTSLATDSAVSGGRYDSASYLLLVNGFQVWRHRHGDIPCVSSVSATGNSFHEIHDGDGSSLVITFMQCVLKPLDAALAVEDEPAGGSLRCASLAGGSGRRQMAPAPAR